MEGLEEKLNIQHEAVAILSSRGSGEKLPALHDQPEDVVERLETLDDGILVLVAGNHVSAVTDARQQTLQTKLFQQENI